MVAIGFLPFGDRFLAIFMESLKMRNFSRVTIEKFVIFSDPTLKVTIFGSILEFLRTQDLN